ncbi:small RNA 2'-O-methyltransferase isoform X2 [Silurus meridionalis]|uniref:small RNA 2'-O-methyltransferase isoform X2 n=1 Tax=Silurus meridionalis TaxID=175797 RepID=UPI001EECC3C0|nr:small RNA 2'-O-methyltransferase isoform X2 [Silurus meridionalis]
MNRCADCLWFEDRETEAACSSLEKVRRGGKTAGTGGGQGVGGNMGLRQGLLHHHPALIIIIITITTRAWVKCVSMRLSTSVSGEVGEMLRNRRNRFFSPPLFIQRHEFVIEFVKASRPRTLLDLGCSECSLLRKLRFHRHGLEVLAGVDIDGTAIRQNMYALAPLMTEYLQPSARPLTIQLYQGSITETEPCTKGFDLITCMEVMEHLHLWELGRFSDVLFEHMEPRTVIISTPNSDFNPLFPGLTGFRHKDHKFEWTRAQFQAWADGVCRRYGYSVEFTGVGEAPGDTRDVGFCSQVGVFHKVDGDLNAQMNNMEQEPIVYQLLYRVVYPSLCDNNIFQRTVISEALYRAEKLKTEWLKAQEVRALCRNIQHLRATLQVDLRIQLDADREAIMLPDDYEEEEEETDEDGKAECVPLSVNDNVIEDWESEL